MWRILVWVALATMLSGAAIQAQPPTVSVDEVRCFPEEDNGVVSATVQPEVGGASVRLYFRWNDHGTMYYVDMVPEGGGRYWGVSPKAEERNDEVEYYVAVVDASGQVISRSEAMTAPVLESRRTRREGSDDDDVCEIELTPRQYSFANNLTVGETVRAQEGNALLGWLCDGVVTRINYENLWRPDDVCRGCVIPWWQVHEYIVPAMVGVGTGTLIITPPEEQSPSRP